MKFLFSFLLLTSMVHAQSPPGREQCQSQLMRLEVDTHAMNGLLMSPSEMQNRVIPQVRNFLNSELFRASFLKEYPIPEMGFPFNTQLCNQEKARGNTFLRNVDCANQMLCSDPAVPEEAKAELCFEIPCSMVLGSNMSRCPAAANARPTTLDFSQPISLRRLDMVPQQMTYQGTTLRTCFHIEHMETHLGVTLGFQPDARVDYGNVGLQDLNVKLDTPRDVCMTATVDFTSPNVVSNIQLQNMTQGNFVSDAMIDEGLRGSTVTGVTGYSPATIAILKTTGLPPLARHFRPTVEAAITSVLATTFEAQLRERIDLLTNRSSPTTVAPPTDSIISEIGVGNFAVRKYADLLECSLMKRNAAPIPPTHPCLTQTYPFGGEHLTPNSIPAPDRALNLLRDEMNRNENVTSEALRTKLLALRDPMQRAGIGNQFGSVIQPMADRIRLMQTQSPFMTGVQFLGQLNQNGSRLDVGVCLPETCDQVRPSPHAGRNIAGCPIQTYIDLNEMNNVLRSMYNSGRICSRGRGDFVPQMNGTTPVRNSDGSARGTGCVFAAEDDKDGLRCFLNGPPQIRYDQATSSYHVALNTKECFRGGVFIGLGKIAGDINFDMGFTPTICDGGSFCLENGSVNWNVVPGTARYALRDGSFLNGIVRNQIDSHLRQMISQTMKFPLTDKSGPMANIPLEPEGRVDRGQGFFGACLRVRQTPVGARAP